VPFSALEQEAIILNAVWDMIDGMVNYGLLRHFDKTQDTNLQFHSDTEARLFNILLADFLSKPEARGSDPLPFDLPRPPDNASPSDRTYLFYLRLVCAAPQLAGDGAELRDHVEAFGTWLEATSHVEKVWLADISVETDITVTRFNYLRICGDIAKHNFSRLDRNVIKIRRILADNGKSIDVNQGFLALPNFYEWFHRDLFLYHASMIGEFLNNIRWSIYRYLRPEYDRAYRADNSDPCFPKYKFDIPAGIQDQLARSMYWDLMNRVRGRPYLPEFTISHSLKER
jgi:hypothetical protein